MRIQPNKVKTYLSRPTHGPKYYLLGLTLEVVVNFFEIL